MSKDLQYVDTLNTINNKINRSERQMVLKKFFYDYEDKTIGNF